MKIVVTKNSTGNPKDTVWTVIDIPDDEHVEVDIIEEDEDHWAHSVKARRLSVAGLRNLLVGDREKVSA